MATRRPELHTGHRARMKKQLLETGLDGMNDHQIAEVMLFFSIPRGDTNELAHILVNEFGGTISGVLNAGFDRLSRIKGIGEHTSYMIYFIKLLTQRYLEQSYTLSVGNCLDDTEKLCEYFKRIFLGVRNEELHILALNDSLEVIRECKLIEGSFDKVTYIPRKIISFAETCKCNNIAIAHNHPTGSCLPSMSDVEITSELMEHLSYFDINLIDHIIIGKGGAYSLASSMFKIHKKKENK